MNINKVNREVFALCISSLKSNRRLCTTIIQNVITLILNKNLQNNHPTNIITVKEYIEEYFQPSKLTDNEYISVWKTINRSFWIISNNRELSIFLKNKLLPNECNKKYLYICDYLKLVYGTKIVTDIEHYNQLSDSLFKEFLNHCENHNIEKPLLQAVLKEWKLII